MKKLKHFNKEIKSLRKTFKPFLILFILWSIGLILLSLGIGYWIGNGKIVSENYTQIATSPYKLITPVFSLPTESVRIKPDKLFELINKERASKGLSPFQKDEALTYVAYLRAKDMLDTQEFSHLATQSGLKYSFIAERIGYIYKEIKENLALGFSTEEQIIDAWKKSQEHADNIYANGNYDAGIYAKEGKFYGENRIITVLVVGLK